jgi:hypothetical protein
MKESHDRKWKLIYEAFAQVEAEIIRGMLEAQDIQVLISQEGYAGALGVTVDMGRIEVLVPDDQFDEAARIVEDYQAGNLVEDGEEGNGGAEELDEMN